MRKKKSRTESEHSDSEEIPAGAKALRPEQASCIPGRTARRHAPWSRVSEG